MVHALEHLVPHKAGPEALGPVKEEEVGLRLGMPVGQIAGPVPPVVQHLPQDHVGARADLVVENGVDPPLGHAAELARAGVFPGGVLRAVEAAGKALLVLRALDQDLRPGLRGDGDFHAAGGVDAPRALGEDVPAAGLGPLGLPGEGRLAAEQQHRNLFPGAAEAAGLPCLHLIDPYVHQHGGVVAAVGGEDHLPGLVKFGISKYLAHSLAPFVCSSCAEGPGDAGAFLAA